MYFIIFFILSLCHQRIFNYLFINENFISDTHNGSESAPFSTLEEFFNKSQSFWNVEEKNNILVFKSNIHCNNVFESSKGLTLKYKILEKTIIFFYFF